MKMRGCLGSMVFLIALGGAAYGGWRWGGPVFEEVDRWAGRSPEEPELVASQQLADETLQRFEAFRRGEREERMALGSAEVESVIRFGVPGLIPAGVFEPSVELADGAVHISGKLAVEAFPELPELGGVLGFLPDTLPVSVEGTLAPMDREHAALVVHRLQAMRIPLPDRMIPDFLWAFGQERDSQIPEDAMPVRLPRGIESAYILRDSLVLVHRR